MTRGPSRLPLNLDRLKESCPMVRNYKPRNPVDPGSKLSAQQTLGIIRYLIAGRRGAWIAKMARVSENTVSSVAKKFRHKMRASPVLRQGCFEPFYVSGNISREFFEWVIDLPSEDADFYQRAGHCALNCTSEFENKSSNWSHFLRSASIRLLNIGQSQRFFDTAFGDRTMRLRISCSNCPANEKGLASKTQFYNFMGHYLRERNLRIKDVQDHYLLCALSCALHYRCMGQLGVTWTADEIRFPEGINWDELQARFIENLKDDSFSLVQYVVQFLEDDPL
jgi:hypothetical protein